MNYALYLESGPRRKKTMVHVLDLLGCIARGTTTGEALEATPGAIRDFLRFLQCHGDGVDPEAEFTTAIAEHVMEGPWLGNGNPEPGFAPDFQPLTLEEQGVLLERLGWLRDDLLEMIGGIPPDQLLAEPEGRGRPIIKIVDHIADAGASGGPAGPGDDARGIEPSLGAFDGAPAGHDRRGADPDRPARKQVVDRPPGAAADAGARLRTSGGDPGAAGGTRKGLAVLRGPPVLDHWPVSSCGQDYGPVGRTTVLRPGLRS